jgi:ribonucleoside-diphosphate reductase alpha chain
MVEMSIYDELGVERKQLQEDGLVPDWCTTAAWQMLKENYLSKDYPDLKSVYTRVAKHAAQYTNEPELWETKFFNLFWKGYLAASTPVLSNMGTGFGCPVSCSGGEIADSVHSFYGAQQEAAILSKNGFGTSGYMGNIRPRGSKITGLTGSASGILPVFKDFVQMSRDISQGSQRRGAWAGYVEIDHGDFYELVNYISKNPDDANVGWNISDAFIDRLDNGDTDAIERFQKAMKLKMVTGKGYFNFIDKVNRQNPKMYKDKGLKVLASNLCLTGDTIIQIKLYNNAEIEHIRLDAFVSNFEAGVYTNVLVKTFNDTISWSSVSAAAQTAIVDELYEIESPNGKIIRCTASHKIFTQNRGYVEAQYLIETDELLEI